MGLEFRRFRGWQKVGRQAAAVKLGVRAGKRFQMSREGREEKCGAKRSVRWLLECDMVLPLPSEGRGPG